MRPLWTAAEIVEATGGRLEGLPPETEITAVSIDSREVESGALFVAIKGDTNDGHDYVPQALTAGAAAVLVSDTHHKTKGGDKAIVVADPLAALVAMGKAARGRNKGQIVAITGSAGKTSTKEAIRTALSAAGTTHASVKSFNNHWGVPLTLARLPADAQFGVFEIGMNHAGEITPLVQMVRPHIAVITTVAAAHLEFFNSVADIAAAKAEIFLGLEPGGTAVLNADHEYLHILFAHARAAGVTRIVTYGYDESADWRIVWAEEIGGRTAAEIVHDRVAQTLSLEVQGRHMVANAVAAVAVAALSGEGTATAIKALEHFGAPEGRGMRVRLGPADKPLLLVDESYNANVASMGAAMDLYSTVTAPKGDKVLVLGDMLEMGPQGPGLHAGLADQVLATGAARVYLVGSAISALAEELGRRAAGDGAIPPVMHFPTAEDAATPLLAGLAYGDAVMVKGSKGVRLASLVTRIRERFENASA